ncbi:MAG: hypothetical protein M3396_00450 [Actinomycetota bacterium]|nr:hypothetical protein [Actinomycetota bacterium]
MTRTRFSARALVVVLAVATSLTTFVVAGAPPAEARPMRGTAVVQRNGRPVTMSFTTARAGEGLVELTASAGGVDWGRPGAESAVVSVWVDGTYASDLVIFSEEPTVRRLALGHLGAGQHTLELRFAADRSPAGARRAKLRALSVDVVAPTDEAALALRHAPVLYGRSIAVANAEGSGTTYAGPFQNAVTDTPLLAWHEVRPAAIPGNRILEYSVVWSNEDGGTNSPALMARWGRTTDIEWIYRVEVDAAGNRVPGTAVYQGPNHLTLPFDGTYEDDHPLLQTCTANNMVCDDLVDARMRFFLAADASRPANRAREVLMDRNPWTYPVMAKEMVREGRIEPAPSPTTPALGDQRSYLYLEVDKDTVPPNPPTGPWVGLAVQVRLAGDANVYRSDHFVPDWSIKRDVPAATTVELPLGTTADDVVEIIAHRVVVGPPDPGSSITVTDVNRAFFLDSSYLPQPSFIDWHGSVTLSPAQPAASLWTRQAGV